MRAILFLLLSLCSNYSFAQQSASERRIHNLNGQIPAATLTSNDGYFICWLPEWQPKIPDTVDIAPGAYRTLVSLVVGKDGAITDVKLEGSSGQAWFDAEVLKRVWALPPSKPLKRNGEAAAVYFVFPVSLHIE